MDIKIPKLIFIIPYRNREKEKKHYSIYMKYIMEDYDKNDYEIYYSHQTDNRPFNRGATKNIGFIAMKNKYLQDYKNITFVFNDIDTLPALKNTFNYITTTGTVKHFYGYQFALGGIFSIIGSDFEKCNGFPNNWGWGLEDNAMYDRVLLNELKVDRAQFFVVNSKEVIQIYDTPHRLINNNEPNNYISKNLRDNLNSIYELDYSIENNNILGGQSISEATISEATISEATISEATISEATISEATISEATISEATISEATYKISYIPQNEFIINIVNFRTLVNPANEIFYNQNTFYDSGLRPNIYEDNTRRSRWGLTFKHV